MLLKFSAVSKSRVKQTLTKLGREREKKIDEFLSTIKELPDSLKQQLKDSMLKDNQ